MKLTKKCTYAIEGEIYCAVNAIGDLFGPVQTAKGQINIPIEIINPDDIDVELEYKNGKLIIKASHEN